MVPRPIAFGQKRGLSLQKLALLHTKSSRQPCRMEFPALSCLTIYGKGRDRCPRPLPARHGERGKTVQKFWPVPPRKCPGRYPLSGWQRTIHSFLPLPSQLRRTSCTSQRCPADFTPPPPSTWDRIRRNLPSAQRSGQCPFPLPWRHTARQPAPPPGRSHRAEDGGPGSPSPAGRS